MALQLRFQFEFSLKNQVFYTNFDEDQTFYEIASYFIEKFKFKMIPDEFTFCKNSNFTSAYPIKQTLYEALVEEN
jgi:hypothetical protein